MTRFLFWLKKQRKEEETGKWQTPVTELAPPQSWRLFEESRTATLVRAFIRFLLTGSTEPSCITPRMRTPIFRFAREGFLLADTGGHYKEGTTDITRTIALGPLTREQKEMYTLVLKGHIRLADAVFLKGAAGMSLDVLARTPLWERGLDYNHGTGHGVGYLLSVHEGPNSFRYRPAATRGNDCVLEEGMITSDEPGIYLKDVSVSVWKISWSAQEKREYFRCLSRIRAAHHGSLRPGSHPWEMLSEKERNWLNTYHRKVFETLSPYLEEEERRWLREETAEI